MNFDTWFLELQTRTAQNPGAGLVAFRRQLARLGNPQNSYPIIHVAGTNGKGTVCTLLARVLTCAGEKTGLFISPHLISPTERMQIDGTEIAPQDFRQAVEKVLSCEQEPLNFFEVLTAAAFVYFAEKQVKYGVLETGLGGRKDPTNICNPVLSIIASVGLDHTQWLGHTLEQIALEKAGSIKPGVPVLCGAMSSAAKDVIEKTAREKDSPLEIVRAEDSPGNARVQNVQLVRRGAELLGISSKVVQSALETARLPGRFETRCVGGKTIILDGAHNPPAMENLLAFWQTTPFAKQRTVVLCGFMKDKDYPSMLRALTSRFEEGIVTVASSSRAAGSAQLAARLPSGWKFIPDVSAAWEHAQKKADVILCTGSFYLVGAVLKNLSCMPGRKAIGQHS